MMFEPAAVTTSNGLFIDGRMIPGEQPAVVASPSDVAMLFAASWASTAQIDQAVVGARRAWRESGWGTTTPRERAATLRRFADAVDTHAEELCRLESLVSARIYGEALARDVRIVSGALRFFGEYIDKVDGAVTPTDRHSLSLMVHEPHGVVAAISPWNFPMILAAWKFAPALAAGNAVVLKPSELTPFTATRLAELAAEAGLPAGLFNVIHGDAAVGAGLVRHPGVDYVTFTGSSATGARIMADAALHGLKPVSLELGGKGPQLVFDDACDLDRLAALVARGITYNAGQVCFAGSRLIVQRGIADVLLERVAAIMADHQLGATWDSATTVPPIISPQQLDRMEAIVGECVAAGGEVVTGGRATRTGSAGFYAPTILRHVDPASRALREEIFGPVLAVQEFDDEEEGIALANHADYGLTASVHTRDIDRAFRAARAIESGTVWINDWGRRSDFTAPFGGYKRSGLGKDMGRAGYEKYLKTKAIWVELS